VLAATGVAPADRLDGNHGLCYDEPEILPSSSPTICLTSPDGGHSGSKHSTRITAPSVARSMAVSSAGNLMAGHPKLYLIEHASLGLALSYRHLFRRIT
jgi:hypothetical protein